MKRVADYKAVVIGGSAGSIDVLSTILRALPVDFALPVMIVVHLPPAHKSTLPEIMRKRCALQVIEAEDKTPINPGHVYFAPPDYHMLVESTGVLSLSAEDEVRFSRPSIDVLFESAVDVYGGALAGVVLTGANDDGARGLAGIVAADGVAVVQAPETAYAPAMPEAAIKACAGAHVLAPEQIGLFLASGVDLCR